MEKFKIRGGTRLQGTLQVSGAKNAALPIMAASLLSRGTVWLQGVPKLSDVYTMIELLQYLGAKAGWQDAQIKIDATQTQMMEVKEEVMRRMRASNLVMGPLLARFGSFKVAYPGGCAIGSRPLELHLKGFIKLGAKVTEQSGYIMASAKTLRGAEIHLDFPSVGATENLMMAAALAEGTTVIRNAAREPELVDLQNFINLMGGHVYGAGTDVIKIRGVDRLGNATHQVIPDRIEAATHVIAAALTQGDVRLTNVIPEHLEPVIYKVREAGALVEVDGDEIRVRGGAPYQAVDLKTMPYPGFPTDVQSLLMSLMAISQGTSIISESIFENRFKQVGELRRMGADITIEGRVAVVKGVKKLSGAYVEAPDLRAGAALVLAGLIAEGTTVVSNVWHIDRGYEQLEAKYASLGADIVRILDV